MNICLKFEEKYFDLKKNIFAMPSSIIPLRLCNSTLGRLAAIPNLKYSTCTLLFTKWLLIYSLHVPLSPLLIILKLPSWSWDAQMLYHLMFFLLCLKSIEILVLNVVPQGCSLALLCILYTIAKAYNETRYTVTKYLTKCNGNGIAVILASLTNLLIK